MSGGDRIELRGLRAFGRHGVLPSEQALGQIFIVDVAAELDLGRPAQTDELADTLDYGALAQRLVEAVGGTRYQLLEALADHLCSLVLADGRVDAVTVRVAKPHAPVPVDVAVVAVVRRRERG